MEGGTNDDDLCCFAWLLLFLLLSAMMYCTRILDLNSTTISDRRVPVSGHIVSHEFATRQEKGRSCHEVGTLLRTAFSVAVLRPWSTSFLHLPTHCNFRST
jgi:hypothetical protein